MRNIVISLVCFLSSFLSSVHGTNAFSKHRLQAFYDVYLLEQKEILAGNFIPPVGPFTPPPNPAAPPFKTGYLPVVLVNNSGLPDNEVYVLITGDNVSASNQVWGVVNTTEGANFGEVTLQDVSLSDNSTSFSYLLSDLPTTTGGRVLYMPEINSGLIWFSMQNALSMTVETATGTPPLKIVQPNFTSPSDPNYNTNFDIFELAFLLAGDPQVSADATAVSFFSIPLYGYLAGATSPSSNTGLYQPRSYIMAKVASMLNETKEDAQWDKLVLRNGNQVLRILATGKSMSTSAFDPNYLDDSAAYGYSYISDIWTGGFYKTHPLNMTVTVTVPSTATYTYQGMVNGSNEFVFTSSDGGPTVTFPAPTTSPVPTGTTSYDIFSAVNFITPLPTAGTAADAVSKLFQEAVIAGLIPTTNTLSLDYLTANQSNYYTVNPNLSPAGQSSGPWYDSYSKALHSLGLIYTYGFDEPLWPQVLLGGPFTDGSTYMGITIGSVK